MKPQARAGLVAIVMMFLAGIWLFVAPLIVDYQNDWKTLADPTKNDMWSGGVLIAIAALTLILFAAFALRDAAHAAARRHANVEQRRTGIGGPAGQGEGRDELSS